MPDNPEFQNRPKPFSKERTKQTIGMIVYFYCVFFVIMKIIAIFQGAVLKPNAIIALPFIGLGIWGFLQRKQQTFSWIYIILGVLIISVLRYYELDLIQYLQNTV